MTKEEFTKKVGSEPELDDLERVNCTEVGKFGHWMCGWCETHKLPVFMCGCMKNRSSR